MRLEIEFLIKIYFTETDATEPKSILYKFFKMTKWRTVLLSKELIIPSNFFIDIIGFLKQYC
jgi:hypothetical protein